MSHDKPATLYGDATLKEGFGAISSFEDWSETSDSIKDLLTRNLETYTEGVNGTLKGSHHDGVSLAQDLLIKVVFQSCSSYR